MDPLSVLDAARSAGRIRDFALEQPTLAELFLEAVNGGGGRDVYERVAAAGDVDAAVLVGASGPVRVVVEDDMSDDLRGVIGQAVAGARVTDALARAGLPPGEVAEVVAPRLRCPGAR